jgi:predicted dinucleotide-utilizing enzyme
MRYPPPPKVPIHSAQMVTRKLRNAFAGAPLSGWLPMEFPLPSDGLNSAPCVFAGLARDAAAVLPANVNVVTALSLAVTGP